MRIRHTLAIVLAATLLVAAPAAAQEGEGRVTGFVRDDFNAMTLPTATIQVDGLDITVSTNMDGAFRIDLPAGTYDLRVSFPGYDERLVAGVVVTAGETTTVDVVLTLSGVSLEETVIVTAELEPELITTAAQLLERKRAGAISDNLAREEMRANADSDAAAAMKRVTGLSVVDNQYVFVRGLGERYSNTMLNGSILPTTEPDKRVVPLDLIPTGLIESVQVIKSYMPDRPAEFSGGLIQIETVKAPMLQTWSLSTKQTFNSQTTFKDDGLGYAGGGRDWFGFDDGTRALPGVLPTDRKVVRTSRFDPSQGFTPEEIEAFGESFSNVWSPTAETYSFDQDYSASYGNRFGNLGLALSVGHRVKNRNRTEDRTFFAVTEDDAGNEILDVQNDYDFQISDVKTRLGVLGNVSYEVGRSRFSLANFWTHQSKDEARIFEGFNSDIDTQIRNQRLFWIEEDVLSSTLRGEHLFPNFANSRVDWHANYSRATREEPDLRETLYELNVDTFVLADESQSGFRMFNDLRDEVVDGGVDWSLFFSLNGLPAQIKVGPAFTRRERDFSSRRFRLQPRRTTGIDLSLTPEEIFVPENIHPNGYELREETRPTDTYFATHDLISAYAMIDVPLSERLRFVGGARVEDSAQEVQTFDLFSTSGTPVFAALHNTDLLPAANLIYQATSDVNIRAGFSRTINRPEFRELSPFEFTDVVGGRAVVGNPDLRRARIDNLDLRFEWFASPSEVFAVSFFYKDFTDPIERVVEPTAQLRTSFTNAKGARNLGFELEARKDFGRALSLNINYTYVDSQIELEEAAGQVQTSLDRALVGQSPHVVNAMLAFRNDAWDLDGRLLFNYFGKRIVDVGSLGLPDIFEDARGQVDLVLVKDLGRFGLQLVAGNLNNEAIRFKQGGLDQRVFNVGRDFAFRVSYSGR